MVVRGEPYGVAEPQRLTVGGEHGPVQVGDAGQAFDFGARQRSDSGNLGGTVGVNDDDHLVAHGRCCGARSRGAWMQDQGGERIGAALLRGPFEFGAVSPSVCVVEPIGFGVDRGLDLGEGGVVEFGVEHAHRVIGDQDGAPSGSLSFVSGRVVGVAAMAADEIRDLAFHGIGGFRFGQCQQVGTSHRFGRCALGCFGQNVDVSGRDVAGCEGRSDGGQRFERCASGDGLIGFTLGASGCAAHDGGVTQPGGAPGHEGVDRGLMLGGGFQPSPYLAFLGSTNVD